MQIHGGDTWRRTVLAAAARLPAWTPFSQASPVCRIHCTVGHCGLCTCLSLHSALVRIGSQFRVIYPFLSPSLPPLSKKSIIRLRKCYRWLCVNRSNFTAPNTCTRKGRTNRPPVKIAVPIRTTASLSIQSQVALGIHRVKLSVLAIPTILLKQLSISFFCCQLNSIVCYADSSNWIVDQRTSTESSRANISEPRRRRQPPPQSQQLFSKNPQTNALYLVM